MSPQIKVFIAWAIFMATLLAVIATPWYPNAK